MELGEIPEVNKTVAETEEMVNLIRDKLTSKNYYKLFPVMRSQIEKAIDDGYKIGKPDPEDKMKPISEMLSPIEIDLL